MTVAARVVGGRRKAASGRRRAKLVSVRGTGPGPAPSGRAVRDQNAGEGRALKGGRNW